MDFQLEVIRGFQSVLRYKCGICGIKTQIYSEKETENNIPINKAVVNAFQAIGKDVYNAVTSLNNKHKNNNNFYKLFIIIIILILS